jgi:RNA polymerase sigma-70 factor (ECF subfamily)
MTRPTQATDPALRAGPASPADPAPPACPGGDGGPAGDAAIIRRSWDEPEQFAGLFRLRAPEIQRYVTRRLGADAAEDVVAETFLAAFRQRSGYDLTRGDARPWLYGIATNLIGHHRRSETRLLRALARTGREPHTEPFTDRVDAEVSAGATGKLLAQALAKLPAPHRDTLLLVAWGDMTYEQAALALGVPIGTVRSRVSRARKAVRRALGDVDPSALPEDSTAEEPSDG